MGRAGYLGKAGFELLVEAPGGQPSIEAGFYHQLEFGGADHLTCRRYHRLARPERLGCKFLLRIAGDELTDLGAQLVAGHGLVCDLGFYVHLSVLKRFQ